MRRILQAARLQRFAQKPAELQAAGAIGIVVRNEHGVALEPVAELVLLFLVLPGLEQIIRHRIVMDGDKQVGVHLVGQRRPLDQALGWSRGGDEPDSPVEAGGDERLLDRVGKLKIEGVFDNAARAYGARHLDGVAYIDDGAKRRMLTGRGFGARRMPCAARRMLPGAEQQDRDDD